MSENTRPLGVVVEFTAAEGIDIEMTPSRPGKSECLLIGWEYLEAREPEQDAMLADLGGVLVRRSLRVFGNYASRSGQREVAEYAAALADEITVSHDAAEAAS